MGRIEEDSRDQLLERVARRYFVDGMLQENIAAIEHLSRPSVSRLLTEARARGVVQFRIGPPVDRILELEAALLRRTPLDRCVVATGKPRALYGPSSRWGYVAARHVETQLRNVSIFGVASSRSLSSLAGSMAAGHRPELTVVDLLGCLPGGRSHEVPRYLDATALARDAAPRHLAGDRTHKAGRTSEDGPNTAQLIAARLGAAFVPVPAPFVYRSAASRDAALGSKAIRDALGIGPRCDLALVGVGSMQRFDGTGSYSPIPAKALKDLAAQGATGHLCGHFITADGVILDLPDYPALLGITVEGLRQIPQRIAAAAGRHKVASIAAAINANLITELVTDQPTAATLLTELQA
ncbi:MULTISPECIES: sugar-binding transcriptional regulator [Arthrobacter]|uniref:Sugar-binding domain-containing protein n=1 Tax=Arthrobacter terricola TaxID=2547396 RepID=A0A4R5KCB0_9MICC|nr:MULTISPECIES: sugar-binding domain-containing protein [Arthrobacter]MBT8162906.1 hypothetical protein [Arthrobacter sp. GN70]TDF91680.1 hypothetical protein E1809_20395 [Arthrobacter terricola]